MSRQKAFDLGSVGLPEADAPYHDTVPGAVTLQNASGEGTVQGNKSMHTKNAES